MERYVIGLDFGSDSVRCIVVNTENGSIVGSGVSEYARWKSGRYSDSTISMFRQHPLDYLEGLQSAVYKASTQCGIHVMEKVVALSLVTTGSTPCPVDRKGTPLSMEREFEENPNAMFHLWKDHTAAKEAEELNAVFASGVIDYTKLQGKYSAEWFWAKILHTTRQDKLIAKAAYTWLEQCDWLTNLLCGKSDPQNIVRCACAASHKALWCSKWYGLPARKVFADIHPILGNIWDTYGSNVRASTKPVGCLTKQWAEKLGLRPGIIIGGTSLDAHAGAVGAGVREHVMVSNIGTSTVNMLITPVNTEYRSELISYSGIAENSIIDGFYGIETGQAAFGDLYTWVKNLAVWPLHAVAKTKIFCNDEILKFIEEIDNSVLSMLSQACEKLEISQIPIVVDWFNGRRYPNCNDVVKGGICGLTLGSGVPAMFYGVVLASVFGMKRILEGMISSGLEVHEIVAVGGIAQKSPFVMQTMANVLERRIVVSSTKQACALGAAIYACVSAGIYSDTFSAQDALCSVAKEVYVPSKENMKEYTAAYEKYLQLGDFLETMT